MGGCLVERPCCELLDNFCDAGCISVQIRLLNSSISNYLYLGCLTPGDCTAANAISLVALKHKLHPYPSEMTQLLIIFIQSWYDTL